MNEMTNTGNDNEQELSISYNLYAWIICYKKLVL